MAFKEENPSAQEGSKRAPGEGELAPGCHQQSLNIGLHSANTVGCGGDLAAPGARGCGELGWGVGGLRLTFLGVSSLRAGE